MLNAKQLTFYLVYVLGIQLMLVFAGCASGLYAPNMQNVPLFQEKNEIRINAAYGITDADNAVELQLAYAPTANIGIQANALLHGYSFYLPKFNNFDVFFGEIKSMDFQVIVHPIQQMYESCEYLVSFEIPFHS